MALAELWSVPHFLPANHGAAVKGVEYSIAADAPMTAAALSASDVPTLLITNDIGMDGRGRQARRWLSVRGVDVPAASSADIVTPWIVVAADDDQTRTWDSFVFGSDSFRYDGDHGRDLVQFARYHTAEMDQAGRDYRVRVHLPGQGDQSCHRIVGLGAEGNGFGEVVAETSG
ncbi:hypothetical protein [Nocardia sp. NPDC050412]|uniref:hypothetical protein n=1 Tax=Nocardia sp. NPDC050412 TaxID=3364320 RepID=UPI0037BAA7C4